MIAKGINRADFNFRHAREELAKNTYYAVRDFYKLDWPLWGLATFEKQEHFLDMADATLRIEKPVESAPSPAVDRSVVVVSIHRNCITGLRGLVPSPIVGMVTPATEAES